MCPNSYLLLTDADVLEYDLSVSNVIQTVRGPNPLCWSLCIAAATNMSVWLRFNPLSAGMNTFTIPQNGSMLVLSYPDVGPIIRQGFSILGNVVGPTSIRITEVTLNPTSERRYRAIAAKILANASPY